MSGGALCLLRRNQHGEQAPQRLPEIKPIGSTTAGTRPVLPCVVCLSMIQCGRHHGNIAGACMPSPCNLGLTRLLSYIARISVWHAIPRPNTSVLLRCGEIFQRDLAPAPASRDALAQAQQRLDSGTAIIASSTDTQEAVKNWITLFNFRAHQSLNDFATSRGSWHARSRRKTSCTSISEPALR